MYISAPRLNALLASLGSSARVEDGDDLIETILVALEAVAIRLADKGPDTPDTPPRKAVWSGRTLPPRDNP